MPPDGPAPGQLRAGSSFCHETREVAMRFRSASCRNYASDNEPMEEGVCHLAGVWPRTIRSCQVRLALPIGSAEMLRKPQLSNYLIDIIFFKESFTDAIVRSSRFLKSSRLNEI